MNDLATRVRGQRPDGLPIYTYSTAPGILPVSITRLAGHDIPPGGPRVGQAHAHDFLVIAYIQRGGGAMRIAGSQWEMREGDAFVIPPGQLVTVVDDGNLDGLQGWAMYFPLEVLGSETAGLFRSWQAHPLLAPFLRGVTGDAQRLNIPNENRVEWSERLAALDRELRFRRDGYREAALAHVSLLLVDLSRLRADVVEDLKLRNEPLLADVFGFIEEHYHEPISLKDVAWAVSLTPGHLTTVVRRKTGRTVGDWILVWRMARARRLLVESEYSIEEIASRVGFRDPAYFVKLFRREHAVTPLQWRRLGRA